MPSFTLPTICWMYYYRLQINWVFLAKKNIGEETLYFMARVRTRQRLKQVNTRGASMSDKHKVTTIITFRHSDREFWKYSLLTEPNQITAVSLRNVSINCNQIFGIKTPFDNIMGYMLQSASVNIEIISLWALILVRVLFSFSIQ
jgi:hypothetical protein